MWTISRTLLDISRIKAVELLAAAGVLVESTCKKRDRARSRTARTWIA